MNAPGTYSDACAPTSTSRTLGRLTLLSAAVSIAFAVAAGTVLIRREGTKAQWALTSILCGAATLADIAALVGGDMCVGFDPD